MTAYGTTHTPEEATVYVCDLDMFVEVHILEESRAVLSLDICARTTVIRINGIQVSHRESTTGKKGAPDRIASRGGAVRIRTGGMELSLWYVFTRLLRVETEKR